MKLFAMGDSTAQGFMSLAAARTDLSFPSVIARSMNLDNQEWRIPHWPKGGLPLNLEVLFRGLERDFGSCVDLWDWPFVIARVGSILDEVEGYYERGMGAPWQPDPSDAEFFHNVAVRGFDIADIWQVSGQLCQKQIDLKTRWLFDDGFFAVPSASFYRTALNVLNPSRRAAFDNMSAIDWLEFHHTNSGSSIENLILCVGSNNALGTIVDLKIVATDDRHYAFDTGLPHLDRRMFNLWAPEHFARDFEELLRRVDKLMSRNDCDWQVFVGNVPAITILPLAKGFGSPDYFDDPFEILGNSAKYFEFYTYFTLDDNYARKSKKMLTRDEVIQIDSYIAEYNNIIRNLLDMINRNYSRKRYHLVDIGSAVLRAAYRRNSGSPSYDFPQEVTNRRPIVDMRYYHASTAGEVTRGGLMSLDGIHPSAIGQGLLAHEFLKVMNQVRMTDYAVDWDAVFRSDNLYSKPIRIMEWLRGHENLHRLYLNFMKMFSRRNSPGSSRLA